MSHEPHLPPDADLIVRALNRTKGIDRPMHRAGHASQVFGLDHMQAVKLCERFGFDPYESVGTR